MKNPFYLILLCLAQLLIMSDNSAVLLSIGVFQEVFDATSAQRDMSQMLFAIISASFMPITGIFGLLVGWKVLFRTGVIFLAISQCIVILAHSMNAILMARIVCGFAASIIVPSTLGLLVSIYQGKERVIAFSVLGMVLSLSSSIAPLSLGTISSVFGWRIPFSIILILTIFILCFSKILSKNIEITTKFKFDKIGSILIATSIALMLFGISKFSDWGIFFATKKFATQIFGISPAIILFLLGVCLFIILIFYDSYFEKKYKCTCVFPTKFLQNKNVVLGFVLVFLTFFLLGGSSFIYVLYMQVFLDFSPAKTGLIYSLYSASAFIASLVINKIQKHTSLKISIRMAIIVTGLGTFMSMFGILASSINFYFFVPSLLMSGFGIGCLFIISPLLITINLDAKYAQQSAGIQAASRSIGQIIGISTSIVLLSIFMTNEFKSSVYKNSNITKQDKEIILDLEKIPFLKNIDLQTNLQNLGIILKNDNDRDMFVDINKQSRRNATRKSIMSFSLVVLFVLAFTFVKGIL